MAKVSLTGVAEAIKKHQGPNVESKGIKAHFSMDDSGILNLLHVELIVEKNTTGEEIPTDEESPLSKLGSTISKLFSGIMSFGYKFKYTPFKESFFNVLFV